MKFKEAKRAKVKKHNSINKRSIQQGHNKNPNLTSKISKSLKIFMSPRGMNLTNRGNSLLHSDCLNLYLALHLSSSPVSVSPPLSYFGHRKVHLSHRPHNYQGECSYKSRKVIRNKTRQNLSLTDLDEVAMDNIIKFLSAQDLRAFHQVDHKFKFAIENRTSDNNRRLQLVKDIRENKENIYNLSKKEEPGEGVREIPVKRDKSHMEPTSRLLTDYKNVLQNISTRYFSIQNMRNPPSVLVQRLNEADKSVETDPKLFYCRNSNNRIIQSPTLPPISNYEDDIKIQKNLSSIILSDSADVESGYESISSGDELIPHTDHFNCFNKPKLIKVDSRDDTDAHPMFYNAKKSIFNPFPSHFGNSTDHSVYCSGVNCSYKFCVSCNKAEHTDRSCRIIESDSFEECNQNVNESEQTNSKRKNCRRIKTKKSLRRIAKL